MGKSYRIENTNGETGGRWALTYRSREDAAEAIRLARGWDEVVLSGPFTDTDRTDREVTGWCAYESQEECDRDGDGARAPRVVELLTPRIEYRWANSPEWKVVAGETEREAADRVARLVDSSSPVPGAYKEGEHRAAAMGPHCWQMPTGAIIETREVTDG
jgi:hypothetical protein